jgi:REP element-mobilizing transposase RayT
VPHWSDARSPAGDHRPALRDRGGELIEFNGEADHVHVLGSLPPNLELSRFVNTVKTTSSRLIRRDFGWELRGKLVF